MREYTAVHWVGEETHIEYFSAATDGEAFEAFEECGPNAYDDRQLLSGHVQPADIGR